MERNEDRSFPKANQKVVMAARMFLRVEGRRTRGLVGAAMALVHHECVIFSGRVQGVGFRYSTLQVAKEFEVSGYVSNLADGRVQVEAEGRADEIAAFVTAIEERMHSHIRKTERLAGRREAQFSGFVIR